MLILRNTKKNQSISVQALGMSPSPFDCYLVTRGIKTLHLRMKKHMDNTLKIAESLLNNPNILKVIYPGKMTDGNFEHSIKKQMNKSIEALKTHPNHDLYLRQMKGCCGIISIYIKGDLETAQRFVKFLKVRSFSSLNKIDFYIRYQTALYFSKIFTNSESLGGVESSLKHPGMMNYSHLSKEKREELGIGNLRKNSFTTRVDANQDQENKISTSSKKFLNRILNS